MGKFKVGDTVRCTQNCPGQFTSGNLYEVESVGAHSLSIVKDDGGRQNDWSFEFFELVNPSPIRTVTRREIVAGMYGGVHVFPAYSEGIRVRINERDFSPADLREAARIFNEIADVLDEQKEAA